MRAILIVSLLLALPLMAQSPSTPPTPPAPSAEKESFTIQPAGVDRGARNFAIRLVANKTAGFSNSSSKTPNLTFSAGVTLVAGTFQLLNQNEAQASIDVDDDAEGTIEVKLELFSVNGTTVLTTLRGTLGIKGTTPLQGSQAEVGAESVKLVQVNVTAPQAAGALLIKGRVAGTVSVKAPTGTNFSALPVITTTSGTINSAALEQTNTLLNFSIGNASLDDVTVRIDSIQYNTQFFGLLAQAGDLACELSGAALANQTALVVNAFTAKTEIKGTNDNTETPPPATGGNNNSGGEEENGSNTGGLASNGGMPLGGRDSGENNNNNRNNRRNEGNNDNGGRSSSSRGGSLQPESKSSSNPAPLPSYDNPPDAGASPGPSPAPGGGGAVSPGGNPSGQGGGTGSIGYGKPDEESASDVEVVNADARELKVDPGLYFCDKDFKPVTALVLDKAVSGEAGGRVWIVLKLAKDKQSDKVETVTVKLIVNGVTRELALTETGKNTGEFRCGEDGILVIANENPDSNTQEAEAQPPKPRYDR